MKQLLILMGLFLGVSVAMAQPGTPDWGDNSNIGNLDVVVVKNNKIVRIPEAYRHYTKINYPFTQIAPKSVYFNYYDQLMPGLPNLETKIRLVQMKFDNPLDKLYGNYVKAGFGNYVTPYAEAWFANKRNPRLYYALHVYHLSSKNGPVANAGGSDNQITGSLGWFRPRFELKATAGYGRRVGYFYGVAPEGLTFADPYGSQFIIQQAHALVDLKPKKTDKPFSWSLRLAPSFVSSTRGYSEVVAPAQLAMRYAIDTVSGVEAELKAAATPYTDTAGTQGRAYFTARVNYYRVIGGMLVRGGLVAVSNNDTLPGHKAVYVMPYFTASYSEWKGFRPEVSFTGGQEQQTLGSHLARVPYLANGQAIYHKIVRWKAAFGAEGDFSKKFGYEIKASYASVSGMPFYINSPASPTEFALIYDRNNVYELKLSSELIYFELKQLRVSAGAEYRAYTMSDSLKPWHVPAVTVFGRVGYNWYDKIYVNLNAKVLNGMTAYDPIKAENVSLPNIIDLNLNIHYRWNERWGAFADINNITAQKYERYLYYPLKGINVIMGVNYSF